MGVVKTGFCVNLKFRKNLPPQIKIGHAGQVCSVKVYVKHQ